MRRLASLLSVAREFVRRVAGRVLPKAARDWGWRSLNTIAAVRFLGVSGARRLLKASRDPRPAELSVFTVRTLWHPFWIRHGTSDADELTHTVLRKTYGQWLPEAAPRWILDLGANIGDTAAWFLSRFPSARVVALEPDPSNYAVARRNLEPYGSRAILVNAAVWPTDGELVLKTGGNQAGASVRSAAAGETTTCLAVSIPTLMARYGIAEIDLLKCDIEGAEEPLFGENPDPWLSRTGHICIEIHSPQAAAAVFPATTRHGFRARQYRDVFVLRKG